ncbi:MAG: nucleotide sugar dehydrogenase [Holosporaceae bacterium]|nr:MAG: nucleotide sugar dehydrogenase [Holosporaceae bacterium]
MYKTLVQDLVNQNQSLAVVGLGYVGLPLAVAFSEKGLPVVGFDVSKEKIKHYKAGHDVTQEVGNDRLRQTNIHFTDDTMALKKCKVFIVTVPTPVHKDNTPDLSLIEKAATLVGQHLSAGSIVVFESTVYPGVTEKICMPLIEHASNLKGGKDFKIGYSPERINPGDTQHRLETITKVTAGMDKESGDAIGDLYGLIIEAGIHRAPTIMVAEAAKVIENAQRDINIAFMNELSLIFDRLGVDTLDVLEAARTKWNFLPFMPGLVGGHCIGVDPYYLAHAAKEVGHHAQVILSGRHINDAMGKHVAEKIIKKLAQKGAPIKGSKVGIMGLTFKENCPDLRNSKVVDIIHELEDYGVDVLVTDPLASPEEAKAEYGISLHTANQLQNLDALVLAVPHEAYTQKPASSFKGFYKKTDAAPILFDLKGMLKGHEHLFDYWRL